MLNNSESSITEELKRNLDKLTTNITYIVLIAFILVLIILLIKSWLSFEITDGINNGEVWLGLFRDGFLILSGILTTLIGYYFGNRGSDAALKQIEDVKKENQKLLENLNSLSPTNEDQDSEIEPIKRLKD